MRVNDERRPKTVPFSAIECGEMFTDEEGDFMMRTEEIEDATLGIFNVVNLKDGAMYQLNDDAEVIRIVRASINISE